MDTSPIGRICQWAIGAACIAGLAACGGADQRAGAPNGAAAASASVAPQALATVDVPTNTVADLTPTAGAIATVAPTMLPTLLPSTLTIEETAMPHRPSAQTPDAARPSQQPATPAPAEIAKADLARRRSVAPDTIKVVEVRDVVWPDLGLGCPRPGMAYKQVQVDGLLIRLESGGRIFEYHSGGGKPPFLCEPPTSGAGAPAVGGEDR
jgi:hypothetical protein